MQIYGICFFIALFILLAGIIVSVQLYRRDSIVKLQPMHCLAISVFLSGVAIFVPAYLDIFRGSSIAIIKTVLLSIHNTIRLFIVDGEFDIIRNHVTTNSGLLEASYTFLAAILFVLAPVLTFGVIVSLAKSAFAYVKYIRAYNKDIAVFSELNPKSLALAGSLKGSNKSIQIVYTDVFVNNEEETYEMMQKAKRLKAIAFKTSLEHIDYGFHSKKRKISFFLLGREESENILQTIVLTEKYRNRDNTELYLFSSKVEGEMLLANVDKGKMKVRRINEVRSLIDRFLYNQGEILFHNSRAIIKEGKIEFREIRVLILGFGQYGLEMTKCLSWLCQMDGYRLYIDVCDVDPLAEDKFAMNCPELLDKEHNGIFKNDPDDAQYEIHIHGGIDCRTKTFCDHVKEFAPTFVFIALGSDSENIEAAINMRMRLEQENIKKTDMRSDQDIKPEYIPPDIVTVCYDPYVNEGLKDSHNFRGQPYNIRFIGSLSETYSEEAIVASDLEEDALKRHLRWGQEEEFWKYEYNYRSSVAATIHARMTRICMIPGVDKSYEELKGTEEGKIVQCLEHRRWNAYMRSEGWIKGRRNDIAKMHHDLVPNSELSEDEKLKDLQSAASV